MTQARNGEDSALRNARGAVRRGAIKMLALAVPCIAFLTFVGTWIASASVSTQPARSLYAAGIAAILSVPILALGHLSVRRLALSAEALADARQQRLDEDSRHREFASEVAEALDMAHTEPDALLVIERAFGAVLPDQPVELLLADNSHAHMSRMASTSPSGDPPGCSVSSPSDCPAARRARLHYFPDSESLNACPKLAGRSAGRSSALCLPVSVMGRTVGVIHTIGPVAAPLDRTAATDLQAIANQSGARIGMLRITAETQLQASTDSLTGLLNRRAFENSYLQVRDAGPVSAVVMADLDHFKKVNDTYGHDTGDRALRIFAETLRSCLRSRDLVSRRGGEEFALFMPGSNSAAAVTALHRVRAQFQVALRAGGLPTCTASFGVVEVSAGEDLDATLGRADVALFDAKRAGRDRIVVQDADGEGGLFAATASPDDAAVLVRTVPAGD